MSKGKLYGTANNFRTQKVLAAAKLAGNKDLAVAGAQPPADKFPLGVTPAYEDGNVLLFGAESIGLHLLGGQANAEVIQWLQFAEATVLPAVLGVVLPSVSAAQLDTKVVGEYKNELVAILGKLNDILVSKTFVVGERLSLADISLAFDLLPAYQHVLDAGLRAKIPNVNRWFQTVVNQPAVKEVVGAVSFISQASTFDANKFKQLTASQQKAAPAPAKEAKKKEAPAAAAAEELDAADEAIANEPKATDPFAALPKGTFVLDNFKRVYSNEDTATKAIPFFWETFDPENYSIWYGEYKYPEDLTLAFMSCNLINGMYQRLEKLKKNAFASVCLFGTDNNSTISGVWVWKGHDLAFTLAPDWQVDYESYEWKKLDPSTDATKKLVNEYLLWEGDFDGKKFNQGKIFK